MIENQWRILMEFTRIFRIGPCFTPFLCSFWENHRIEYKELGIVGQFERAAKSAFGSLKVLEWIAMLRAKSRLCAVHYHNSRWNVIILNVILFDIVRCKIILGISRGGGTFSNQVRLSIRLLVTIQNFYILLWHRLK